ncbi:type II toxin-antitoxin system PemK/MazF family toxin [Anoxybacillus flavithermus]|uniref:Uncharacterized protein n=1 Tax=Anoxybacillus flavithermus TaxID=33934 RepID=A0A178TBF8_9BACL|nr:type II toxin-antitoxin system PemK/MazF family toxin [Anoxybacillus flavithermus]MBE2904643.1 type II toxin-antitoxin system PemK/MazF family toxin [Anoxybacillus flavithermus]MBE2907151.1 type II toxin-antitoxin system PemK/MazF family toxin [Anoxybacillus flavithermus]MBE2910276.1 type II toxin-antitoxin system PemK/MazF family toxin [Anoxybacillus flavithermus]MBE2915513.1 type II toxin-antitoxin system PemK/MazF family toxin [Anoxybacillus flavithermus]MBE2917736.1 type II toxin-antito
MTEHIRSVSKARLWKKIGKLSEEAMRKVEEAVMVSLGVLSSKDNVFQKGGEGRGPK